MTFHEFGTDCTTGLPTITTFTATPQILVPPADSTTINWAINLNGNPISAQITTDCGLAPYTVTTASGSHQFTGVTPPCKFTLTQLGLCGDATASVTVATQPPPGKVPSLTELGMIILSLILAISAIALMRKKYTVG